TAVGRNTDRLAELAGAGFATAAVDLSESDGIAEVVAGHSNVVLISGGDRNRVAQHLAVIHAAKDAGVEHLYYTSGLRAAEGAEI
ncbi:NAD(P)H-binding protein, partial [Bacillus sp. SIMBA_074]|uniref:NAD(P)H-binding protein n=1 Tax=Bacillus sp. SIMBA_074 TaxID=3085812 RepID=UPI00397AFF57